MTLPTDGGWFAWFLASAWYPFAAALLIQMATTQIVKFWFPVRWDDRKRRRVISLVAIAAGAIPAAAIMVDMGFHSHELWLAVVVGLAGPMLYKAITALLYSRWPELEGTLSAHGRARRKRNAP